MRKVGREGGIGGRKERSEGREYRANVWSKLEALTVTMTSPLPFSPLSFDLARDQPLTLLLPPQDGMMKDFVTDCEQS